MATNPQRSTTCYGGRRRVLKFSLFNALGFFENKRNQTKSFVGKVRSGQNVV